MGAYLSVADRYLLLPHGASMGLGYGPVVVARDGLGLDELGQREIVILGRLTTAYLVAATRARRARRGPGIAVRRDPRRGQPRGRADAGPPDPRGPAHLRRSPGCTSSLDPRASAGRPRPGCRCRFGDVNVARRDLGERLADVSAVLSEAIRYGLDHRDEALAYAERFGFAGIDRSRRLDRFVAMYVNEFTCDLGETGRRAVDELLARAGSDVTAAYV